MSKSGLPRINLREEVMFGFGTPQIIIILFIVLLIFGVGRLPEIGSSMGRAIKNFKKGIDGKDE